MASGSVVTFHSTKYVLVKGDYITHTTDPDLVKKTVWILKGGYDPECIDGLIRYFRACGMMCVYDDSLVECVEVTGTIENYSKATSAVFKCVLSSKTSQFTGKIYGTEKNVTITDVSVPRIVFDCVERVLGFVEDEVMIYDYVHLPIPDEDFAVLTPSAPITIPFNTVRLDMPNTSTHSTRVMEDCRELMDSTSFATFYFMPNTEMGMYEALKISFENKVIAWCSYSISMDPYILGLLSRNLKVVYAPYVPETLQPTVVHRRNKRDPYTFEEMGINRTPKPQIDFNTRMEHPKPKKDTPTTVGVYLPHCNVPKSIPAGLPYDLRIVSQDGVKGNVSFSHTLGLVPIKQVWNFGDFTESTIPRPSHQYLIPGKYTVTLSVWVIVGSSVKILNTTEIVSVDI